MLLLLLLLLKRLLLLKILLLLLSGEVRAAKIDLTGGQCKRHGRFSKVSGGSDNQQRDPVRGRKEGVFRMADLEILLYHTFQTPKLRLNPDS